MVELYGEVFELWGDEVLVVEDLLYLCGDVSGEVGLG